MKLTVQQIVNARKAISDFNTGRELPAKLAYRLGRLLDKAESVERQFKKTDQKLIVEKYGAAIKDADGKDTQQFQVPPDKMEDYAKEVFDILNQEEEMDYEIPLSYFDGINAPEGLFKSIHHFIKE
jgi:hypothetical protein